MGASTMKFNGQLKYNHGVNVSWGDAIVYSDFTQKLEDQSTQRCEENDIIIYKEEIEKELKVIFAENIYFNCMMLVFYF